MKSKAGWNTLPASRRRKIERLISKGWTPGCERSPYEVEQRHNWQPAEESAPFTTADVALTEGERP